MSKPSQKLVALGFAFALAGAVYFTSAIVKAHRSLTESATTVTHEGEVPFRETLLDKPVPAGFEPVSSAAQFSDAVRFNGRFYLCGPGGLFEFDPNGALLAQYRPGMELPPSPLTRMAVGIIGDGAGPQLWIATASEGLLAFDGHAFRQVRPQDSSGRHLTAVLPLGSGRVLVGTEKAGILAWDGKVLRELNASFRAEHITALTGSEADLWAGTIDHGLLHWHAGQLDRFSEAEGLPDPRVLSLAVTADRVFAGTPLGVAEFQSGRFTRALASGFFANALLPHGNTLSIGTLDEGVIDLALSGRQPTHDRPESDLGAVQRLFEIDNHTYALTDTGLIEAGRSVLELPGARLTDRNISALNVDRTGKLWVGYFDRGLDILDPGFARKIHLEDDHLFCVNRIAEDVVATANGLVLFDANQKPRRVLTKADGLIANHVTDVLFRDGVITVATPAGLTTIGPSGTSSLYAFHGLVNNHVYALAASESRLLAGTLGGLSILDSGVITASYTTSNSGLKHNWITSIAKVNSDWFLGTYGAGVLKMDAAGRWTSFADLKGEMVVNPNAMTVTNAAVYAGTLGRGLAVYSRASERWIFVTTGLPSLNVTALTAANGYLYIGTDNGLVRIPESQVPAQ